MFKGKSLIKILLYFFSSKVIISHCWRYIYPEIFLHNGRSVCMVGNANLVYPLYIVSLITAI